MIALFPASSLDASILTSVLVGLVVLWFFQETLGWTFTGLVVPGYLATILLVQPAAGLAITLESVATWGVVLALSDHVPRWWPWTPLFGRDRFLAFLLASVGVRVLFESGGLALATAVLGLEIDAQVHALGLVVVPLMAHAMWRSGLAGLPRIGIPVLLTWALLRFVVLAHTNLSVSSFALTYEDLAGEFVNSPRHYVLLLVGATLGSWVNLNWGSDFGGLIVPGLLALCWLQPDRLAATVAEAVVIAAAFRLVIRLPGLRSANLTGGRPLVLAYVLGYLLKFFLGWSLGGAWPGFEVRSLFGFGYLLSSLLALRLVKHGEIARSLVPALGTSLVAVVLGQGLTAVLVALLATPAPPTPAQPLPADPAAALVVAAWGDEGGVPNLGERGFWTGGDGFGGLLRREGAPILVRARAGELGMAEAALAVADALGARAVQLCGPEGEACDAPVSEQVVWLLDGAPALGLPGGAAPIDVERLTRRTGALTLVDADRVEVRLPWRTRAALADRALVSDWSVPTTPVGVPDLATPGELRGLREAVLRPALAWVDGEDAAGLAAARAPAFGLHLRGEGELLSVRGPGWTLVLLRGGGPLLVDVPAGRVEEGAVRFGLALARALEAGAVLLRAEPATEAPDAATVALAAVIEGLGISDALTVREVPRQKDPGADVVLSRGRVVAEPAEPAWAPTLRALGLSLGHYDGSAQRAGLAEGANPARSMVEAAGGRHLTLWVRSAATERLLGVEAVPALAREDLPRERLPWAALGEVLPGRHALDRAATGARRSLACDALLGCRWVIERAEGAVLLPLAPGFGAGRGRAVAAFSGGAVVVEE